MTVLCSQYINNHRIRLILHSFPSCSDVPSLLMYGTRAYEGCAGLRHQHPGQYMGRDSAGWHYLNTWHSHIWKNSSSKNATGASPSPTCSPLEQVTNAHSRGPPFPEDKHMLPALPLLCLLSHLSLNCPHLHRFWHRNIYISMLFWAFISKASALGKMHVK